MIGHDHPQVSPPFVISFHSIFMRRRYWAHLLAPQGHTGKTACRETYGLLLYAGVAQSVELYRAKGYAIECPWSLVRVQPSAQEAG